MFEPRRFLFGLVEVAQWMYEWGYSRAYIELMCVDTTIYKSVSRDIEKKVTREDADEAVRRYMESHNTKDGFRKIKISQLTEE